MSQPWKQALIICKGIKTMKFDQVIEYMKIFFLEKSYANCGSETIPRLLSKKLKLSISILQLILYSLFLLYVKSRAIKIH